MDTGEHKESDADAAPAPAPPAPPAAPFQPPPPPAAAPGPGRGKKPCPACGEYVGNRSFTCRKCSYDFRAARLGLDAAAAPAAPPVLLPEDPALSNLTPGRVQQMLDRRLVGPEPENTREERAYMRQREGINQLDGRSAPYAPDPARSAASRRGNVTRALNASRAPPPPVDGRKMPREGCFGFEGSEV